MEQPQLSAVGGRGRKAVARREAIIEVASELFSRGGYEQTNWAEIASGVGLDSTSVYYYFESKIQCLFAVMTEALRASRESLAETSQRTDFTLAMSDSLRACFALDRLRINQNRALSASFTLLRTVRESGREERARVLVLEELRALERAWSSLLERGMDQGAIPRQQSRMVSRALLGVYNSIWIWYQPGSGPPLDRLAGFFVPHMLAMAGVRAPDPSPPQANPPK